MAQGVPAPVFGVFSGLVSSSVPLPPGCPMIAIASGIRRADASSEDEAGVLSVGLLMRRAVGGDVAPVQFAGLVSLTVDQWDAVTGDTGGLAFGTIYYVGSGSSYLSTSPGSFSWPVGIALSANQLLLALGSGGGGSVSVDDITIGGDGQPGDPLHAIFAGFDDNVKVLTDGTSIVGSGITGDPLMATGGGPGTTNVQPFTYQVTGLEPDLSNITVPITPSQPDGTYQATVTQGVRTRFLATSITSKAGASLVLSLSADAAAGDTFDFLLARAP